MFSWLIGSANGRSQEIPALLSLCIVMSKGFPL
jgi:hypothetical protein